MLYCLSFVNRLLLHSLLANLVLFICQERNETIQSQLDYYSKRQKFQKKNATDKANVSAPPKSNGLQNSPGVHCIFFFFPLQGMVVGCLNKWLPLHWRNKFHLVSLLLLETMIDLFSTIHFFFKMETHCCFYLAGVQVRF